MNNSTDTINSAANIRLESDRDIVIERTFDAQREAVFKAWTDPNQISHWWDPDGTPLAEVKVDLRPGGSFSFVHQAGGRTFSGTYREIRQPSLLIFATPAPGGGETIGTLLFEDRDGKTHLKMTMASPSAEARDKLLEYRIDKGTVQTLENLNRYLTQAEAGSR